MRIREIFRKSSEIAEKQRVFRQIVNQFGRVRPFAPVKESGREMGGKPIIPSGLSVEGPAEGVRRSQAGIPWSGRSAGCWQQDGLWKSDNDVWKLRKIYDDEHLDINLALTLSCHPKIAPATTSTEPLRSQGKTQTTKRGGGK